MIDLDKLDRALQAHQDAEAQMIAHNKDGSISKPPFDEWYGPMAMQDAAIDALDALPELLRELRALRAATNPTKDETKC